ncbi:MAG: hypothetical protein IZT59_02330 [Verrucomicrobia bacterium]|jgi:hypothetical protein|nr:hypothetical protein [Verrucomicrobiota bacterium]|tara:strand:- start:20502 stop:20789 length:288 start_codon:yes stop_codon:yes gene_type:complete
MRRVFVILLGTTCWLSAYDGDSAFEKAWAVIEVNCVECHTPEEAKGGLIMTTAGDFLNSGDSGKALVAGNLKNQAFSPALPYECPENLNLTDGDF